MSDFQPDVNIYISLNETADILSRAIQAPVGSSFIEELIYDGKLQSGRLYRSAWYFRADEVDAVAENLKE